MKQKLTLLLIALCTTMGAWADDYSQGYYTISPGANTSYQGFYSASNGNSKYGGTSSKSSSIAYFTFEKTDQENVYYWYDCSNKKYIYADGSGYLQVADTKSTEDNNYKWFIKDDGNGNLTITDMTNYNDGNPTKGLVQLSSVGGWWASKCTFSQNTGRNTWKFNLLMKKNVPYYIGLQRAADRYLQYGSNKMQQAQVSTKSVEHIWYFTDEGTGSTKIYALPNITAMGYAANAEAGADKIATTNSVKNFYIKSTNSTDYPFAFLTDAQSSTLYLSNNGGVSWANMGLYSDINDSGTRLKVEDASDFFAQNQTVNLITSYITIPYSGGAGTAETHVSINHIGGTATLTGAENTYYLAESYSATNTTVNFDGTTANYSDALGIGTATYNFNNTQITTPRFITSQGGNNRPAVVNLTGNTKITVTGNSNVDTNQSSIMIGHWNGSSNVTLDNTAQIEAVDAQLLIGKTANIQTITLNGSSNITAKGIKVSSSASGTNTLNLNGGSLNLGEVGITSYSSSRSIAVNVTENSTITATAETLPISQPISIATGKTLTIDGGESNAEVTVTSSVTNDGTVIFRNATLTINLNERDLSGYAFTDCTATLQFTETGDEYKTGGFTITNIPAGVTIKVKKYDATEYETVTPEGGTATVSHSVGVSGNAAWLDYTFNMSTIESNTHNPADRVIANAGNAGTGNNLTIDTGYNTDNSYNEDGTLKVMSTPWRDITWPTNYTVAVAGNVPDVENGCLVAFGSINGTGNYLAILRGATQNEIKLVKGYTGNNAFEVISTMSAANATALSHLVVFTKQGNTFDVYLDGVNVAHTTYSATLGGGLQLGSVHGGVGSTGIVRVAAMTDETAKAKVFAKAIRVYDYVISADQMSQLTTEFPYTSYGGKYTRTISENSNLDATDAWLNASTQDNADVPVNAVVDAVTYYPDVEITTTSASTLTVNANMDTENIKFNGAGKLTIVSDGTHNIHVYGSFTANGPVSVKYGETDLTAVPVTIGGGGSVEFDFSDSDFSGVNEATNYNVTGNTSNYGEKVTGVYPDDEDHTFTLAHDGTSNRYILTVGPSVVLKQKQAIALVKPYYDDRYVGEGLGKYTISLGETSYSNLVDFGTAVSTWVALGDCVEPTIALNMPTNGFYRFVSQNNSHQLGNVGKYIHNYFTDGAIALNDTEDETTIFYVDRTDNTFLSYDNGLYLNNYNVEPSVGNSYTWTIEEGTELGKYALKMQSGWYASDWESTNKITYGLKDANAMWAIEPVESLPVTMRSPGNGDNAYYGTIMLPVAVTIPNGLKAYKATVNGDVLTLTKAVADDGTGVLAANQPVVLYSTGNVESLTISDAAGTTADGNELEGTIAAETVEANATYVLSYNSASNKVGFYKYNDTEMPGFKAYLPASVTSNVKGFTFSFEDIEDAIRAIESENNSLEIYDIAGRRVQKAQKGLYIVNGKKVMYK